jgi:hypothetical protein
MDCPTCGARVSEAAASCAVCGKHLGRTPAPVLQMRRPATGGFETRVGGAIPADGPTEPPGLGDAACVSCGNPLEREARFCSECGTTVAPPPAPAAVDEPRQPTVVIPPALGGPVRPASTGSRDRAPDETAPLDFMATPVSIELPTEAVEDEEEDDRDVDTAFLGSERAPVSWSALGVPVWVPAAAAGLAAVAFIAAAVVHLLGAPALPGFTPAELDLKVQIRAIEWLMAGMLLALVGLLLKR